MAVGLTGLTSNSFPNLQLDAGVFIEGLDLSTITNLSDALAAIDTAIQTDACLGATSGGMTFSSSPEFRDIDLDGMRQDFKGSKIKDKTSVTIETTLTELTPENMRRIICASDVTVDGDITIIRERLNIDLSQDYIDSLTWIGDINDGRIAVITLYNCLNTNGTGWVAADKANANFAVTFTATNADLADRNYAPYDVRIFNA